MHDHCVAAPARRTPRPAEVSVDDSHSIFVLAAQGGLPEGQRAAIDLFYAAERSYAETVELLGIDIGAVKTRLHKARRTLRQRLHMLWREETLATTDTQPIEMRVVDVRKEPDRTDALGK
jgi:DNA-directed RNA polymerase specialized sigma24 family protein